MNTLAVQKLPGKLAAGCGSIRALGNPGLGRRDRDGGRAGAGLGGHRRRARPPRLERRGRPRPGGGPERDGGAGSCRGPGPGSHQARWDIGADGVVVPWVESADQLRQAVSFARYAAEGVSRDRGRAGHGLGGVRRRARRRGQRARPRRADHSRPPRARRRGGGNVPGGVGVEVFFLGPADFSATAGFRGQWEGPGVAERLLAVKDAVRRAGKHLRRRGGRQPQPRRTLRPGVPGARPRPRRRSVTPVAASNPSRRSAATAGSRPAFESRKRRDHDEHRSHAPRRVPGPTVREVSTWPSGAGPGDGDRAGRSARSSGRRLQPRPQPDHGPRHCFAPSAGLTYHTHPVFENRSRDMLKGIGAVSVEGREYDLEPLDNVVIPRGLVHRVTNLSRGVSRRSFTSPWPATRPPASLCADTFELRPMPASVGGVVGAERVNRFLNAPRARLEAGPGTSFIDFFNESLLPGIEMSGGYGLFQPGGRLPAHVHDFDESICIIEGDATCVVEGRRFPMRDAATCLAAAARSLLRQRVDRADGHALGLCGARPRTHRGRRALCDRRGQPLATGRGLDRPVLFARQRRERTAMGRRLEGRTAWISGASSGIGEATARLFADEGANVALADIRYDGSVRDAIADGGGNALALAVDVGVEEQVRASMEETAARFGGLNIVVNCAGIVHVRSVARVRRVGLGPADGGQPGRGSSSQSSTLLLLPPAQRAGVTWSTSSLDQAASWGRPGPPRTRPRSEVGVCLGLTRLDRPGLRRGRSPLQLRLPGNHRHAGCCAYHLNATPDPESARSSIAFGTSLCGSSANARGGRQDCALPEL